MGKIKEAVHEIHHMDMEAGKDAWLNQLHPVVKLLVTIGYILCVVSIHKYNLAGLLLMCVYPMSLMTLGDISIKNAIKRMKVILILLCFVGIANPIFDHKILFYLGNIGVSGGVISMLTVMLKGVLCVLASYILMITTKIEKICYALKVLHLPEAIGTMVLLIYRYSIVLLKEVDRIRIAYAMRAPNQKGIHYKAWGSLVGQLLLRSMERGQMVYESMLLRGYHGEFQGYEGKRMNQIDIRQMSFSYGKQNKAVLNDVEFQCQANESIGIIGANGAGKSTLLKLLVGLELGYEGEIFIEGTKVSKESLAKIRSKIGYVFQDSESQLFMPTVYEDVSFAPRNYGCSPEDVERRTMRALKDTHIERLKDAQIYRLSGGEKKLTSIATILSMDPSIILLDEPSVALDPKNRRNLIHVLNELNGVKLIASHDLDFIYDTCERTILIGDGRIVKDGDTKEILTNQELLEACGLELPLSMIQR